MESVASDELPEPVDASNQPEVEEQEDQWTGKRTYRNTRLSNMREVRMYIGGLIRRMDNGDLTMQKGRQLLRAAQQLHGLIRDEITPVPQPGLTANMLILAGDASPIVQLARQFAALASNGSRRVIENGVSDGSLVTVDAGTESDGSGASVAV